MIDNAMAGVTHGGRIMVWISFKPSFGYTNEMAQVIMPGDFRGCREGYFIFALEDSMMNSSLRSALSGQPGSQCRFVAGVSATPDAQTFHDSRDIARQMRKTRRDSRKDNRFGDFR